MIMNSRMKVFAERCDYNSAINLHFRDVRDSDDASGMLLVMAPASFHEIFAGSYADPAMHLHVDVAQKLMDELWHCGIRPTNGVGSVGQLAATERHLEDMRALAFKQPMPTGKMK
jgi:hypothetical protein